MSCADASWLEGEFATHKSGQSGDLSQGTEDEGPQGLKKPEEFYRHDCGETTIVLNKFASRFDGLGAGCAIVSHGQII